MLTFIINLLCFQGISNNKVKLTQQTHKKKKVHTFEGITITINSINKKINKK